MARFAASHISHICVEHGFHNVSRWMTWLPISLKNAAKCDKWYQLQNHLITESLNAKGAREKLLVSDPRACRIAQCRKTTIYIINVVCKKHKVGKRFLEVSLYQIRLIRGLGVPFVGNDKLKASNTNQNLIQTKRKRACSLFF